MFIRLFHLHIHLVDILPISVLHSVSSFNLISYPIPYLSYPFLTSNNVVRALCPSPHPISFILSNYYVVQVQASNPRSILECVVREIVPTLLHTVSFILHICGSSTKSSTPQHIYLLLWFEYPSSTPQSIHFVISSKFLVCSLDCHRGTSAASHSLVHLAHDILDCYQHPVIIFLPILNLNSLFSHVNYCPVIRVVQRRFNVSANDPAYT